jgi:mRNA-degrading endonuclease RelE of RelBE toxin-antitoxin system
MDKIAKALQKLSAEERGKIKSVLVAIKSGRTSGLDIKKLKGRQDVFRARKGQIRIIYRVIEKGAIYILAIERRNDNTY